MEKWHPLERNDWHGITEICNDKDIFFDTDVENHYFDRVEEPGELKVAFVS